MISEKLGQLWKEKTRVCINERHEASDGQVRQNVLQTKTSVRHHHQRRMMRYFVVAVNCRGWIGDRTKYSEEAGEALLSYLGALRKLAV